MKITRRNIDKYQEELIEEIVKLYEEANNEAIEVIVNRIAKIGMDKISKTDMHRLANMSRIEDMRTIKNILQVNDRKAQKKIDEMLVNVAKSNDLAMADMFKLQGIMPIDYIKSSLLQSIIEEQGKILKDNILNISKSLAFMDNGIPTPLTKYYSKTINKAIYNVVSGYTDYNSAMRKTVRDLAKNGLQYVEWDSGYHRRLDSTVRMNLLDGVRQVNMAYRENQGRLFGSNGVEISAHSLCAVDHQPVQGKQYTMEEFDDLQDWLERPIGTMNCRHSIFPIVIGISQQTHTQAELDRMIDNSNKMVEYTDQHGNKRKISKYEATQRQRQLETSIRKLKEERETFKDNDNEEYNRINKLIKRKTAYYKSFSAEVGLPVMNNRLQIVI